MFISEVLSVNKIHFKSLGLKLKFKTVLTLLRVSNVFKFLYKV